MSMLLKFLFTIGSLLLHAAVAGGAEQEAATGLQLVPAGGSIDDALLVTLLDGLIVAVEHNTGRILWTYDTGAPLVSAQQTAAPSQGTKVIPGADGALYAYHSVKNLNAGLERLPISLPELVEAAPSLTADGSIILGRRESKVFLLDKRNGRPITTISNAADALEDHSGSLGLSTGVSREHLLLLGRQDYVVRSVRVDSKAETWNVTFSRLYMMPSDTASIKDFFKHGAPPSLGGARRPADLPRLVVGSDGSLQAYDSKTRLRKWYIAFNTIPVSAYRQDGIGGDCLDPEQQTVTDGASLWALGGGTGLLPQQGPSSLLSAHKVKGKLAGGSTVLVGELKGSGYYALPADHLMLAVGGEQGALPDGGPGGGGTPPLWPNRIGHLPMDITPADTGVCQAPEDGGVAAAGRHPPQLAPPALGHLGDELGSVDGDEDAASAPAVSGGSSSSGSCSAMPSSGSNRCSSSALAVVEGSGGDAHGLVPLEPSDGGLVEELGSLTCPQPPLGIHSITIQQEKAVAWLPDTTVSSKKAQPPSSSNTWSTWKAVSVALLAVLLLPLLFGWRAYYSASNTSKALAIQAVPLPQASGIPADIAAAANTVTGSPQRSGKKGKSKNKAKKQAAAAADATDLPNGNHTAHLNGTDSDPADDSTATSGGGSNIGQQQVRAPSSAAGLSPSSSPLPPADASHHSRHSLSSDPGAISPSGAPGMSDGGAGGVAAARSYVDEDGAVVIGKLRVGPGILGYGSAGTIVYEGVLDSRPVAVKRLLRQFYNLARKEIQVLVVSDEHPNVVRCFAMEEDREFVYLALERCRHSLSDTLGSKEGQEAMQDPATGAPTPWCLSVLSDIAAGLAALHARQIVHRDLKPHNVLLTEAGRAKLSDMGLSKQLVSEQSSFESHGSGGSSGWQAPEQLIAKDGGSVRQSRAVDVFSLGCIMYYCLTAGKHPFGEHYERDTNILRGLSCLTPLQRWPEALNLVAAMLAKSPGQRPTMAGVLGHPFWWSDEQRLQFLVDVSDRVENEDREPDPSLLHALESYGLAALGPNWGAAVDAELIANLGKYRRYDYTCLRDLLRVVRNKRNHFREMPESLQQLLGPLPDGYYRYFSSRFPMLLLGVFFFALKHLQDDLNMAKYWAAGEEQYIPFSRQWDAMVAAASRGGKAGGRSARRNSSGGLSRLANSPSTPSGGAMPPQPPRPPSTGAAAGGPAISAAAAATGVTTAVGADNSSKPGIISFARVAAAVGSSSSGGGGAAGPTAITAVNGVAAAAAAAVSDGSPPVVGYAVADGEEVLHTPTFPVRPGKQHCDFYIKTGHCKYGADCVFDHPAGYAVALTEQGLPFRPDQPVCTFYQKTAQCKYGPACKFHHPKLVPIYAGSALQA